jgi:DNA repair exonuclease SbcCD nuclease subunit
MTATVLVVGDPHFQISNIPEVDMFVERMTTLAEEKQPDIIIILGDLLHTHERLHTTALNKAYDFVNKMRNISKTYVLVGNHDMCLGKNTPVLLWNGETKMSQYIKKGDKLIGDDGNYRSVLQNISGKKNMYLIHQIKGDDYSVTEDHILSLKCGLNKSIFFKKRKNCWVVKWVDIDSMKIKSKFFNIENKDQATIFFKEIDDIDILDISVKKYLQIPQCIKNKLYGFFTSGIYWEKQEVLLDPYIMGIWLGDENKDGTGFENIKLLNILSEWANKNNTEVIQFDQFIYFSEHKINPLKKLIKYYKIYKNKHIPKEYVINDYDTRLKLLAGFIDTKGSFVNKSREICITQKGNLIDELKYLIKSLGFAVNKEIYNDDFINNKSIYFSGNIEIIPTKLVQNLFIINNKKNQLSKLLTQISVTPIGISDYYGFTVDNNNRFLLGDFTVTHNCNNQQFLSENHWMGAMKEWDNVVIVDKVISDVFNGEKFVFIPYVFPGRFVEALNTMEDDWHDASCIFAHQEFSGCKMGAIISVEGDKWPLTNPHVISGHIHSRQIPQPNIYYSGSAMQHAFGESEKNIIAYLTFKNSEYEREEINLSLPRKKIIYMDADDIDDYEIPDTEDKLKITVSGVYDQFKAFKKTKKYKDILEKGIKIIFKPKRIEKKERILKEDDDHYDYKDEDITDSTDFTMILSNIVNDQKNPHLLEMFELVVNNKKISSEDIIFLTT